MTRAKSNTSLDERALTEAAKAIEQRVSAVLEPENCRVLAEDAIATYNAVLPEPPLDESLKEQKQRAQQRWDSARAKTSASGREQAAHFAGMVAAFKVALEALAEQRKEGQHG